MAQSRPNLVLITCHDLGRHLGCYGVETVRSPNLDRLAAEATRFDGAFCVSPGCSPSRAALATGRYPHANGVMGLVHGSFGWDLGVEERHTAQLLGAAGYETHLFGLQHVSPDEGRLGFAHVHGRGYGRDVIAQASEFLRAARSDAPLYVELNLFEPHRPYDHGGAVPDDAQGVWAPPYLPDTAPTHAEMAALQGAIRAIDAELGAFLRALDESGLADDTLLVFTADHGIAMPRAKCTLYDPGIGITLLIRWSGGGLPRAGVAPELLSNVDVLPTLLEAAGVPAPPELHGRSFLPLLLGHAYHERDAVFAEKTYHSYYDPMRGVRTRTHKLIRNWEPAFQVEVPGDVARGAIFRSDPGRFFGLDPHPLVELYDLAADPWETDNLAGQPETADVQRELDARLWSWMRDTNDPLLRGPVLSPAYVAGMAALPPLDGASGR